MSGAVAVTAAAARTALGESLAATRAALAAGRGALAPPPDAAGAPGARAARLGLDDPQAEDDPALRILGPHGRLLEPLARAVHDAAGLGALARERVGLFAALPLVDTPPGEFEAALRAARGPDGAPDLAAFFGGGWRAIHPLWPLSALGNVAAGQVSIDLDVRGDNAVLGTHSDAGLGALLEAVRSLELRRSDAVLVMAATGRADDAAWLRLRRAGAVDPEGAGVAPGEGGVALALERAEDARARGRRVLGIVRGVAGAFGPGPGPGPGAEAIAAAVDGALDAAGLAPAAIARVHLARQGTAVPDRAEAEVVAARFPGARCLAHQPAFGHLGPAAGLIEAALALAGPSGDAPGPALVLALGFAGGAAAAVLDGA